MRQKIGNKKIEDIPLKYSKFNVIPDKLVKEDKHGIYYRCRDGIVVDLEYTRTCNNSNGMFDDDLEKSCRELYNMSFYQVKSVWEARLGRLCGFWHWVRMIKVEEGRK